MAAPKYNDRPLYFICLMLTVYILYTVEGVLVDVRLDNGITPNEGTVWYTEDCQNWYRTCGSGLGINDVIVICRHLGFAGANRALKNSSFGGPFDNPPQTTIECGENEEDISTCPLTGCSSGASTGGAVCYGSNYLGCYTDKMDIRVLNDKKNLSIGGLTIDKCFEFCRSFSGMVFAGLELGNECYCGGSSSNYSKHGPVLSDSQCHYQCDGSQYQSCGGNGKIAIFNLTADPHLPPNPMDSPCSMTTPSISTTSSTVTESTVQTTTSQETSGLSNTITSDGGSTTSTEPGTSQVGLTGTTKGTTSDSDTGTTTSTEPGTSQIRLTGTTNGTASTGGPTSSIDTSLTGTVSGPGLTSASTSPPEGNTMTTYAAIGVGVAAAVVVCIIVTILVYRWKCKPKQDKKYGVSSDTRRMDIKDDQQGEIEKNAVTAQMKKGTMPVEYVNMQVRDNPGVMEPESSYENLANDAAGENAVTSKEAEGFDGLYAVSMNHRPGPDGREVAKDAGSIYALPEKGRKSKASHDASVQSVPDECEEDAGDLYAVPEKNSKSKVSQNVPVLPLTDDLEAMYAMPNKPKFRQEDDGDTTVMVENDLYGSQ